MARLSGSCAVIAMDSGFASRWSPSVEAMNVTKRSAGGAEVTAECSASIKEKEVALHHRK